MERLKGKCIGDCSKCRLLADGEVDMVPCVLDQIFARVRKQGEELAELRKMVAERDSAQPVLLAGMEEPEIEPDDEPEEEKED